MEKRKRGPIVVGVPEPVFPPPLHPPRRQAHKKKITYPRPPHDTCSIPGHSTVSAHGVERSMNAPAHRLAWILTAHMLDGLDGLSVEDLCIDRCRRCTLGRSAGRGARYA